MQRVKPDPVLKNPFFVGLTYFGQSYLIHDTEPNPDTQITAKKKGAERPFFHLTLLLEAIRQFRLIVAWQFRQNHRGTEQIREVRSEVALVGHVFCCNDQRPIFRIIAQA